MRDRLFYLISVLAISLIIGLALLPGKGRATGLTIDDIVESGFVLKNEGLQAVSNAPGTISQYKAGKGVENPYLQLSTNIPRNAVESSAGVFGTMGTSYENAFGGRRLKVSVSARQSAGDPLNRFLFAYFAGETGLRDSGWKPFKLTPEYQTFSFIYDRKVSIKKEPGNDYVGIWPGDAGESLKMDVEWIKVEVIGDL